MDCIGQIYHLNCGLLISSLNRSYLALHKKHPKRELQQPDARQEEALLEEALSLQEVALPRQDRPLPRQEEEASPEVLVAALASVLAAAVAVGDSVMMNAGVW